MGITGEIKQISTNALDELRAYPQRTSLFFAAESLPESSSWHRRSNWQEKWAIDSKSRAERTFKQDKLSALKRLEFKNLFKRDKLSDLKCLELRNLFVSEWEIPELNIGKTWETLTFLFAGYTPGINSPWTAPDLLLEQENQQRPSRQAQDNTFASFLVIKNSDWDGLPLVNAIGAGANLGYETGYSAVRYLLPDEVAQILDGLMELGEAGVDRRVTRELQKKPICPWIDGYGDDLFEFAIDYYRETVDYYRDAVERNNSLLLYLI